MGHFDDRYVPSQIPDLENIQLIATGYYHSLVLNSLGQVFSFGLNYLGQLGFETDERFLESPQAIPGLDNCIHVMCGDAFSLVHLSDQRVMVFGENRRQQLGLQGPYRLEVPTENQDLVDKIVVLGGDHMLVGDPNGNLLCYGTINNETVAPCSGINLAIPNYHKKKFGKKSLHI